MPKEILSVAFSYNNQTAFISDFKGNIKMIKWQVNANSGDDFDFTEEPTRVGSRGTYTICLTKDEKYLLVGSNHLLVLFEIMTKIITKRLYLAGIITGISLIKDGKEAIIADRSGTLSFFSLETLERLLFIENITNDKKMYRILLI